VLFGKNKETSYGLPVIKHVAEIIVSDDPQLFDKLRVATADEITDTLDKANVQTTTSIQQMVEYLRAIGCSEERIVWFKKQLTLTLMTFKEFNLPYEYSKIAYMSVELRKKLERDVRKITKVKAGFSDSDWSVIHSKFSKYVEDYSCKGYEYDPGTNGIVGFLVNTFDFFLRSESDFVTSIMNTTGLNNEFEGSDYSRADYATVETVLAEDLENFDKLAGEIYQVSDFMYRHNNRVYYDIFSRYKFKKAKEKMERIQDIFSRVFEYAGLYRKPELVDINFTVESGKSTETYRYAYNKAHERDNLLSRLDPILEDKIDPDDLPKVIRDIEEFNTDIYKRSRGKEGMPVLDYSDYKAKSKLSNDTRIMYMVLGMCALRDFLKYLRKMGVNVFGVPSAIFKDERMIRRFKTYKEYRELYSVVAELINGADEEIYRTFMTNDEVYSQLMESNKAVVSNIPLDSIKDVLEQYTNKRTETAKRSVEEFISIAKLKPSNDLVQRFLGTVKNEPMQFPEVYRLVADQVMPKVVKHLMENQMIRQSADGIYWEVDAKFSLKDYVEQTFSPAIYKEGVAPFVYPFKTDAEIVLSFFRSFDFIQKFVTFVGKSIEYLASKSKEVGSDLRLYLLISEHIGLFKMPKTPTHNDQFEWLQKQCDLAYYMPKGSGMDDINGQLVQLYKIMYGQFSMLFSYLNELYNIRYSPMNTSLNLVEQYPYEVSETLLGEVSFGIYREPKSEAEQFDNFRKFKNLCVPDKYGFLFKKGMMYKKNYFGAWRYLHEKGYWVMFDRTKWRKEPIKPTDVFEVE
jgi:hypothetical protein